MTLPNWPKALATPAGSVAAPVAAAAEAWLAIYTHCRQLLSVAVPALWLACDAH